MTKTSKQRNKPQTASLVSFRKRAKYPLWPPHFRPPLTIPSVPFSKSMASMSCYINIRFSSSTLQL